ncbi:hypothetical protein HYN59_10605 [Flavobacterium album]|uniref:Uncharacterized protein n=1 Tax=Flavobacterium album TaxID=2175091 RepID=A0A2S1QYS9_9FLAO|nr:hypothetical protein HYN59_10605 [Flavobacterium album]
MKAFWNYYITVNIVNCCFSLLVALFSLSAVWFPIIFCTIGIAVGIFTFNVFYKAQYYFYHNLGYTRQRLAFMTFGINLLPGLILLLLIKLFS